MSKNAYINVRVDEKTKKDVEDILEILGINMSTAIDIFLNQIVLNNGLPFKMKMPSMDITVKEQELAEALNLTGGKPYPKKFKKIINLYGRGDIDYDVAFYAIKKIYEKDKLKDITEDLLEEYDAAYKELAK
ncbi:type II toxin-antitoxin system RelB/DinJ family antitoxin [Hujiaoplasma nucleasis]|uniref:Type II toxin-antitoxin system RelB/DinJ family antitoxin n=1 Tax=Hujiaoplasma nucleasis TaxID=2725268 RepID=A0A7L6N0R9_9MOLU|nr:type II toxin-antitoxin system RelB/DinJ family antitoxin [Hujiaoplasma nucleasis]QLY39846.1 type II toxin-antitoxin system RelB/DinJ family antitoxin [Hujiaoplasma nucleasis]